MVLLLISIILFNVIAFKTVKRMSKNIIVHIWAFTIIFQVFFDTFINLKYHGYWYFTKGIDWVALPAYTILIAPLNLMFLNWFPFGSSAIIKIRYFVIWEIITLTYEVLTMLPEPYGFFYYGWWNVFYSATLNPILLSILLLYYKWISKIERLVCS
jgi:hypothetical protein